MDDPSGEFYLQFGSQLFKIIIDQKKDFKNEDLMNSDEL